MPLAVPERTTGSLGIGSSRGLVQVLSNRQISDMEDAERAKFEAQQEQQKEPMLRLADHITGCWQAAQNSKIEMEQRLLKCMRQRNGVYDPDDLAKIRKHGGSEIYMMLTNMKCRAAEAWIKDVMIPAGERPWSFEHTPIPDLPEEVSANIEKVVSLEAYRAVREIGPEALSPQGISKIIKRLKDEKLKEEIELAKQTAANMERYVEDQLVEGKYYHALSEFITDLVTYPAAFMMGPVVKQRKSLVWTKNDFGQPVPSVGKKLKREYIDVSPFDIYPSPGAKHVQDGYLIHRLKYRRSDLESLKGVPGFSSQTIDAVLLDYGRGGLKDWLWTDQQRAEGEATPQEYIDPEPIFHVLLFWGQAQGDMLREWGMTEKQVPDLTKNYDISAMQIGRYLIMARLNESPLGMRPYYSACYENQNNSIWGKALPELMRDIQRLCNATARALVNNMGIASGPQVDVQTDRTEAGEDVEDIYPWKIWKTKSDKQGRNRQAVTFFQPDMNAEPLIKVYDYFFKQASEVTGIPAYIYGSENVGGAGKTASGLSMLMNAASKTMKGVVFHVDQGVIIPSVTYHWVHVMLYDENIDKTGDINVRARASDHLIMQEQLQMRRNEYLNNTNNPTDMAIIGLKGRAAMHREQVKSLKMAVDEVVPTKEMMEQREIAEQKARAEAIPGGPEATPLNPDGSPKGREPGRTMQNAAG